MSIVLSSIVLALHLLSMNVAAAGPLLCVWLDRKACRQDKEAQAAVRFLASIGCSLMVLGAVLGLILGWLQWTTTYRELVQQFSSRITWGLAEFVFSAVLLVAYSLWIARRPTVSTTEWLARSLVAVLAATNLMYHFPPLFSLLAGAAAGQIEVDGIVTSGAFRRLLMRGDIWALTMHFVVASFAVSGTALIAFGTGLVGPPVNHRGRSAIWGARTALASTLTQFPVGLWMILQSPVSIQRQLVGEDAACAVLFAAALVVTLWLMHQLAAVAVGDVSRTVAWRATLAMIVVVVLMSGVLQRTKIRPAVVLLEWGVMLDGDRRGKL